MNKFFSSDNRELLEKIHRLNGARKDLSQFGDSDVIMEYVLEKRMQNDFRFTQGINDIKCATLVCRLCGNSRLTVGQAPFYTVVKCDPCGYEIGIHEG